LNKRNRPPAQVRQATTAARIDRLDRLRDAAALIPPRHMSPVRIRDRADLKPAEAKRLGVKKPDATAKPSAHHGISASAG